MKKFASTVIIISGVLFVILGFNGFSSSSAFREPELTYGGDAYTGIQNAAAQAANNVYALCDAANDFFGKLFICLGISVIGLGFYCLSTCNNESTPHVGLDSTKENDAEDTPKTESDWEKTMKAFRNPGISATSSKKCPYCGEIVKTNQCEMCGRKNNLF